MVRTIVTSQPTGSRRCRGRSSSERDPESPAGAAEPLPRRRRGGARHRAAASGLLVEKFGGPSVKPYQPEGYLAALNFRERDYSGRAAETTCIAAALYTFWQRTFLHPSLLAFDAPTREECTLNRITSNTPLQALVLLNDPILRRGRARLRDAELLPGGGRRTPSDRLGRSTRAVGRPPGRRTSCARCRRCTRTSLRRFRADPADAAELLRVGEAPVPRGVRARRTGGDGHGRARDPEPARNDHAELRKRWMNPMELARVWTSRRRTFLGRGHRRPRARWR